MVAERMTRDASHEVKELALADTITRMLLHVLNKGGGMASWRELTEAGLSIRDVGWGVQVAAMGGLGVMELTQLGVVRKEYAE